MQEWNYLVSFYYLNRKMREWYLKNVKKNWYKRDGYLNNVNIPHIPNFPQYKEGAFVEEYECISFK